MIDTNYTNRPGYKIAGAIGIASGAMLGYCRTRGINISEISEVMMIAGPILGNILADSYYTIKERKSEELSVRATFSAIRGGLECFIGACIGVGAGNLF
jgi:hypothetical protein